jgi:hypothetical protein
MATALWILLYDLAFYKLNTVMFREKTGFGHSVIVFNVEMPFLKFYGHDYSRLLKMISQSAYRAACS